MITDTRAIQPMLHPLTTEGEVVLPHQFTYPFQYTPHPLAVKASRQLQDYLRLQDLWREEISLGKMFGVLVVGTDGKSNAKSDVREDGQADIHAIWAFSGLLDGKRIHEGFVPPVYDVDKWNLEYTREDAIISAMPDGEEKSERSRQLQMRLFGQLRFLNALGETRSLTDIFDKETCRIPPSGAGECCAPKLLQYAYSHGLRPLCMAEFWLGRSPKGEVRYEGEFYPACNAKCKPILRHMLVGLDVEENPLLAVMKERVRQMRVIYEDGQIIAVYKPAGMLSVRGNVDAPSVESVIQESHPEVSGPLIVHRLDMDTSGVMLIAKDKDTHKALQIQFYKHEIRKRYIALLDGTVSQDHGTVSLPLSPDRTDRPRQMVNWQNGKEAVTEYEVLERKEGRTRMAFYPQTGRTHQLRVHSAHPDGLGCPIVGDRLYSPSAKTGIIKGVAETKDPTCRMYLHAESIDFTHPLTGDHVHLEVPPEF